MALGDELAFVKCHPPIIQLYLPPHYKPCPSLIQSVHLLPQGQATAWTGCVRGTVSATKIAVREKPPHLIQCQDHATGLLARPCHGDPL